MDSALRADGYTGSTGEARGHAARGVNVGNPERLFSVVGGAALALLGLGRIRLSGIVLTGLGGALVYRGLTGHCNLYESMGINRAATLTGETLGNRGVKIEREVTVAASPDTLYRIWRDLEELPRFMSHLERVERLDDRRSRWTVRTPAGVPPLQWNAEIINDRAGELIAWRSTGGLVEHAGSVRFEGARDGRSTIVRVALQYDPPGGEAAHTVAALFGQDAGSRIETDLREFRRAVEAGELSPGVLRSRPA